MTCAMITLLITYLRATNAHSGHPARAHGSGPRVGSIKANVTAKLQPPHVKRPRLGTL